LSYDDGPTEHTPSLLTWLNTNSVQTTFFVVGSRCMQHPDLIKQEYLAGHHLAVHTWSHHALTSLTNEQIVAEIKWTEKCIKDAAGVTPIYMRPPFGDVDDRVRAILLQLGYKIVIWTEGYDTNDWQLSTGTSTVENIKTNFQGWLTKLPTLSNGIIVLEHDLYPQAVDVAVNSLLPMAKQANVQMMPIPKCLGDSKPYLEGAGNSSILMPNGSNPTRLQSAGSVSEVGTSSVALTIIAMICTLFM
jgi:peptidoglycan/xylan/chitin deacetylase (PgdA/CDA1 family)